MNRLSPAPKIASLKPLVLAAAISCAPNAHAGSVGTGFTASVKLSESATCKLNPSTGSVECCLDSSCAPERNLDGGGGNKPDLPMPAPAKYRLFDAVQVGVVVWKPAEMSTRSYSALLGATSSTRLVTSAGRNYLEMTLSW